MITRRSAMLSSLAGLVAAPEAVAGELFSLFEFNDEEAFRKNTPRPLERKCGSAWKRCRMFEVSPGELLRFADGLGYEETGPQTIWKVQSQPWKTPEGRWGVTAHVFEPTSPAGSDTEPPALPSAL